MPIPERLRPPQPTAEEVAAFTELCERIENRHYADDELADLLDRWNSRAGRDYTAAEFRTYYGVMELDEFVLEMLLGQPPFVSDATYAEMRDLLEALLSVTLPIPEETYCRGLLEENLPNSNLTILIYCPDDWFADESLSHVELTPDQILAYGMAKSGRRLPGAPENVPMPYPIPT